MFTFDLIYILHLHLHILRACSPWSKEAKEKCVIHEEQLESSSNMVPLVLP